MVDPVLLEIDVAVATIRFNRPDVGNAIDVPLAQALLAAVIRCESDAAIRCVVLTGAGSMFAQAATSTHSRRPVKPFVP